MGSQSSDDSRLVSDTATASPLRDVIDHSTEFPPPGLDLKPSVLFQDFSYSSENASFDKIAPRFCLQGSLPSGASPQVFSPMPTHLQLKSQRAWPSPPLGPGELDLDYCFKDAGLHGLGYGCSPSSSSSWASPVSTLLPSATQHHLAQTSQPQLLGDISTPPPSIDLPMDHTDMIMSYPDGLGNCIKYTDIGSCNPLSAMEFPIMSRTADSSPHSRRSSLTEILASTGTPKDDIFFLHSVNASPASSGGPPDDEKCDGEEPYARLIYRALMSRPNHAMSLQEMYQWFRENTNRAADEKGGWQNSIRHNLSMNAAFTKRPRVSQMNPYSATIITEDSKRVMEWALEDWAIQDGVQSTTRYRKTLHPRRRATKVKANKMDIASVTSATSDPWAAEHNLKRAISGRKGGRATKKGRLRKLGPLPPMSSNASSVQALPSLSRSATYPFQAGYGNGFGTVHGLTNLDPFITSLPGYRDCNMFEPFQPGQAIPSMRQVMANNLLNGQLVTCEDQLNHYLTMSPIDMPMPLDLNTIHGAEWQPPVTGL